MAIRKSKGRNRHILVYTLGLIIAVVVTDAGREDRQGLVQLLKAYFADGVKRLRKLWVDGAYPAEWLEEPIRPQPHPLGERCRSTRG